MQPEPRLEPFIERFDTQGTRSLQALPASAVIKSDSLPAMTPRRSLDGSKNRSTVLVLLSGISGIRGTSESSAGSSALSITLDSLAITCAISADGKHL